MDLIEQLKRDVDRLTIAAERAEASCFDGTAWGWRVLLAKAEQDLKKASARRRVTVGEVADQMQNPVVAELVATVDALKRENAALRGES